MYKFHTYLLYHQPRVALLQNLLSYHVAAMRAMRFRAATMAGPSHPWPMHPLVGVRGHGSMMGWRTSGAEDRGRRPTWMFDDYDS